jgi:hypothetical protein
MSYLRVFILALVSSVFTFAVGVALGIREGMYAQAIVASVPQGALAVANLHALESGNQRPVKLLLESHVDQALGWYPRLQAAWWHPLLHAGLLPVDPSELQEYIERSASYRINHRSPLREAIQSMQSTSPLGAQESLVRESEEFHSQVDATVKQYAKPAP